MNLEDMMLSVICQTPKDKCCVMHLYGVPKIDNVIEAESGSGITKDQSGESIGSSCLMSTAFQFGMMK